MDLFDYLKLNPLTSIYGYLPDIYNAGLGVINTTYQNAQAQTAISQAVNSTIIGQQTPQIQTAVQDIVNRNLSAATSPLVSYTGNAGVTGFLSGVSLTTLLIIVGGAYLLFRRR